MQNSVLVFILSFFFQALRSVVFITFGVPERIKSPKEPEDIFSSFTAPRTRRMAGSLLLPVDVLSAPLFLGV